MVFGRNTNVTVDGTIFHVQTEDRGVATSMLDTTVHCRGRVLHRRTTKYLDLMPLDADREQALKIRLDDQHETIVQELRSGALHVEPPALAAPRPVWATPVASAASGIAPVAPRAIAVEVLNPRTWLTGKHATLYLVARYKEAGTPAHAARVIARVEGAAEPSEVTTTTGEDGHARLEFDMPRLGAEDAALVIEVLAGDARGQLRFQLRAKPKAPAAG
jgi:hypothetical protein